LGSEELEEFFEPEAISLVHEAPDEECAGLVLVRNGRCPVVLRKVALHGQRSPLQRFYFGPARGRSRSAQRAALDVDTDNVAQFIEPSERAIRRHSPADAELHAVLADLATAATSGASGAKKGLVQSALLRYHI